MQVKLKLLILSLCCFANYICKSNGNLVYCVTSDSVFVNSNYILQEATHRPNPILQLFKSKQKKNKKLMATALAFPFPFGIVGLHRIYLGTAPYVPVVYIGTIGGGFGILPFIDFCVLILEKDFDRFTNNKQVFMWLREDEKKSAK